MGTYRNFDLTQNWINNVAYSHSKSERTERGYRWAFGIFCQFVEKTPQQILEEYERMDDREFRRKYASYLRALIGHLTSEGYTIGGIEVIVATIKSFFKYNDLPLGYVPIERKKVTYHNRDITKNEIVNILNASHPRDRAFFCIMAQTGLRPETLCNLKLKHIQPDFDKGIIPCKIDVPEEIAKGEYRSYFTFMGEESIKYLKAYLSTIPSISPEDYLFMAHGSEKQLDRASVSHIFRRTVNKMKKKGLMDFERKKSKPATIRLYNLRKFFRKYANQAGFEFVEFWMGHVVNEGQDEHYRPLDVEFHRELYKEKAMPFLRLETATPTEHDEIIAEQAQKIKDLERQIEQRNSEFQRLSEKVRYLEELLQSDEFFMKFAENVEKYRSTIRRELGLKEEEKGKNK